MPGVESGHPDDRGPGVAASTANMAFALVRGIRGADIKRLPGIAGNVKQGTLDGFDTAGGVAIGQRLAENLRLRIGDKIKILIAQRRPDAFRHHARAARSIPSLRSFRSAWRSSTILFVYMPLPEAQAFFNKDNQASVDRDLRCRSRRIDAMRAKDRAGAVMRPMIMTDWRERNKTFFDALNVERNVMFVILTLIVLVAALNIISGLIMLVKDKGRDIAILRTMGATRGAIMRIFLITGASIGVAGTLAGSSRPRSSRTMSRRSASFSIGSSTPIFSGRILFPVAAALAWSIRAMSSPSRR